MVHPVILTEGFSEHLDKWVQDFDGKLYAGGKARLRVREMRLYTCAIGEEGLPELKEDLVSLQNRIWPDKKDQESFKWNRAIKWLRFFLKPLGLKELDLTGVKNSGWRGAESEGKHNYNAHFIVLGYVPDPRDKDGNEQV